METNILSQMIRGNDPYMIEGNKPIQSLDRLTKKGILPNDVEHLFWAVFPAERPKTGSPSSRQDDRMNHSLLFYTIRDDGHNSFVEMGDLPRIAEIIAQDVESSQFSITLSIS